MKKKSIKGLNLNKKSISTLNQDQQNQIKGASLWYCDSEGMGCILESRCGNGFCTGSSEPMEPINPPADPPVDHTRGCPSYNVRCY